MIIAKSERERAGILERLRVLKLNKEDFEGTPLFIELETGVRLVNKAMEEHRRVTQGNLDYLLGYILGSRDKKTTNPITRAEALLSKFEGRRADEELGDALESIHKMKHDQKSSLSIYFFVAHTLFFYLLNGVRASASKFAKRLTKTTPK